MMTTNTLPAWANGLDGRLLRIFGEVWARLPDHDRALLAAVIREAGVGAPVAALAWVGDMGADMRVRVDLGRLEKVTDDAAARWVVAHELAHAAMRHALIAPMGALRVIAGTTSSAAEDDTVTRHLEDAADFLAAIGWGFSAEARAFWAAYPYSRWPRWFSGKVG